MRQSTQLSHSDAQRIIAVIQAELEKEDKGAAVAVTDAHGELIAILRTDRCPLPSINNAINKAFTAAREGIESKAIGERSLSEAFPITNFGDLRYTGWGGGGPIVYNGEVVGAVGVSGLSEPEDAALASTWAGVIGNGDG